LESDNGEIVGLDREEEPVDREGLYREEGVDRGVSLFL
jgi:hypothetical protein